MVKKNNNVAVNLINNAVQLIDNQKQTVIREIKVDDPAIEGLYESVKSFVVVLINNEGNIGVNNLELSLVIKEVLEFAQSFKTLPGEKKKNMVILLLKQIVEKEVNQSNLNDTLKVLILNSVDNIIDPAIELAIYIAKGNVKINKTKVKKIARSICPCLTIN